MARSNSPKSVSKEGAASAAGSVKTTKKKETPNSKNATLKSSAPPPMKPEETEMARKEILEIIQESKKPAESVKKTIRRPAPKPPLKKPTSRPAPKPIVAPTPKPVEKPISKPVAIKAPMKPTPKPAPVTPAPKMLAAQPASAELPQPKKSSSAQASAAPKSASAPRQAGKGRLIGVFVAALAIVVVLTLGVFAMGLYVFKWDDTLTTKVAQALPYPAAVVRTSPISYRTYVHDFTALKQYYQKQQEFTASGVTVPADDVIRGIIMDKLINDRVLKYEAETMGLTVTDEEVEEEVAGVIQDAGGTQELESSLSDLYGWGIDDFKQSILRPFLLREKVQAKLSADDTLPKNITAKQRIAEVQSLIQDGGQKFEDLAQQYSEDSTAEQGGDLGYMSRGDLVKEFADAAFALDAGGVSDIVKTKYGYHIIKVEEKVKNDGTQNPSLPEGEELVHARHILIRTENVDEWLTGRVEQTRVYRLIK